jgi:hypothetical protein
MPEHIDPRVAGKLEGYQEQDENGGHDEVALPPGSLQLFPKEYLHTQRYLATSL